MSHMEQANGFTPTHTEHKVIQPTYQVKLSKKCYKKLPNRCRATAESSQMGWVDLLKTLINIVCEVNAARKKDFEKRRLTHNTLPKVEEKNV